MSHRTVGQVIAWGQLFLLANVMISVALVPSVFFTTRQGGVSNYATNASTIVFFSLGFLGCALSLWEAAQKTKLLQFRKHLKRLSLGFVILVLSTYPYKLNPVFENLHIAIAVVLSIYQYFMCYLLAKFKHFDATSRWLLSLLGISLTFGMLTAFDIVHALFLAQLFLGLGFGGLLMHTFRSKLKTL